MTAGRFEEALAAYEREVASARGGSVPAMMNKAFALVALRRFDEATTAFCAADHASASGGARALLEMAQASWLDEKPLQTRELLHEDLGLLEEGRLSYTSTPGGVGDGMFAFYVGVRLNESSLTRRGTNYLAHVLDKPRFAYSNVGKVAQYMIGRMRLEPVLEAICGATTVHGAWDQASKDLAVRRSLVVALFYAGAKELALENTIAALDMFERCRSLKNPLLELEWYLSEFEVENDRRL